MITTPSSFNEKIIIQRIILISMTYLTYEYMILCIFELYYIFLFILLLLLLFKNITFHSNFDNYFYMAPLLSETLCVICTAPDGSTTGT